MRTLKAKALGCLLGAVMLVAGLCAPAWAAGIGSLTVYHEHEDVRFDLHYVAAAGENGWEPTDAFAAYPVDLPDENSAASAWRAAAETLAGYVARDGLEPAGSVCVSGGRAGFAGLDEGLYLVVGEQVQAGGVRYTPVPALVAVRGATEVTVKSDEAAVEPTEETYRVEKVWEGGEGSRPLSVTVTLLRNGEADRDVVLSLLNGWSYEWTVEPGDQWQVIEKDVSDGFRVAVDRDGFTFTVTNTWEEPGEPEQPGEPEEPGTPEEPGEPSEPAEPETPGSEPTAPTPSEDTGAAAGPLTGILPTTGEAWWVVPLLAAAGIILVIIGKRRKNQED